MTVPPVVSLVDVAVEYGAGEQKVVALADASLDVMPGSSTAVVGRSGSGKSTLVSVLSLLQRPTQGRVIARGVDAADLSDPALSSLRATLVGTVFQSFHLDPTCSAVENVLLPWYFSTGLSRGEATRRARELLDLVGIGELADRRPGQMSGGQRQRVSIARALFAHPPLLIADEPTGNLDEDTAAVVADVLYSLPRNVGTALVVVTHDAGIAARASRRLVIARGHLVATTAQVPS